MTRGLVVLPLLLAMAGPLIAQARPHTRAGFWFGFGLGFGSAGVECTGCSNDRVSGYSGYLRLGGTVSPSVLLGGETNGWFHSADGVTESIGFASFVAVFYPSRESGFYLKVGLGGMNYMADDGTDEIKAVAPAVTLGAGYEFRIGRNMSIVPFLNSLASSDANFEVNGVDVAANDIQITLFQLGVGLTWH
jgi:hypothetical protein